MKRQENEKKRKDLVCPICGKAFLPAEEHVYKISWKGHKKLVCSQECAEKLRRDREALHERRLKAAAERRRSLGNDKGDYMRIKIYQMAESLDKRRLIYRSYAEAIALGGVDPSEYKLVFSGRMKAIRLEEVHSLFNDFSRMPSGYSGRSLSVSDVITAGGEAYYCDVTGFVKLEGFDESRAIRDEKFKKDKL